MLQSYRYYPYFNNLLFTLIPYCKGEPFKEIRDALGCLAFCGAEAMVLTAVVNHPPDVESCIPVRWNGDVFTGKRPAVWYISFCTGEASVSEIEINKTFTPLLFKLLQLLLLISVELRRGCSFGRFPYTSKSCVSTYVAVSRTSLTTHPGMYSMHIYSCASTFPPYALKTAPPGRVKYSPVSDISAIIAYNLCLCRMLLTN